MRGSLCGWRGAFVWLMAAVAADADAATPQAARRFLCSVTIVRHGETTANRDGICQGQNPSPAFRLTDLGESQAHELGRAFRQRAWWRATASDLLRARQTAEIVLSHLETPLAGPAALRLDARIREKALGARETQPSHLVESALREEMVARGETPPRLESQADVEARAMDFLQWLAAEAAAELDAARAVGGEPGGPGLDAIMVAHGGFIKSMLRLCGLAQPTDIRNTSVSVMDIFENLDAAGGGDGAQRNLHFDIKTINDTSHLRDDQTSQSRF